MCPSQPVGPRKDFFRMAQNVDSEKMLPRISWHVTLDGVAEKQSDWISKMGDGQTDLLATVEPK